MTRSLFMFVVFASALLFACHADAQVIVAHRGASYDAPENTLAAFNLAFEQDTDGIEGDFYLTSDKKIVCIHDRNTKRTAGSDLTIEKSTLAQLRTLDAGSWKGAKWSAERIPTFEEVLRTIPKGGLFVIELKSKSAISPFLAAELARLDTSDIRLLIIAFDADTIRECKKLMPTVRSHWLTSFKRSAPGLPYHPTATEVAKTVRDSGADGVGMNGKTEVIDGAFVEQLKAGGCNEFHVWTIDSPDDARYFQKLGAFGITTNRPAEIRSSVGLSAAPK